MLTSKTNSKRLTNQEIKKILHEEGPLQIKAFEYKGQSIRELILLFGELSFRHDTLNKKGDFETGVAKKRSFCDIYRFIINYRPHATVKTVKKTLAELIVENKVRPTFCGVIYRAVFMFPKFTCGDITPGDYKGRLGYGTEFGCSIGEFFEIN